METNVLTRRQLFASATGLSLALAGGLILGRRRTARATTTTGPTWTAVTPPTNGQWTALHFAGTEQWDAPANVPGALYLEQIPSPGYGLSAVIRPISRTGPYDFDVKIGFIPSGQPLDSQKMGLLVYDQNSSKVEALQVVHDSTTFGDTSGWGITVDQYASPDSTPSRVAADALAVGNPLVWFRIYQDATTRFFQYSAGGDDPTSWQTIFSEPKTTWLTPTHAGFGVACDHVAQPGGEGAAMEVFSWDETLLAGPGSLWIGLGNPNNFSRPQWVNRIGAGNYRTFLDGTGGCHGTNVIGSRVGDVSTLYIVTGYEISKSADGGNTWSNAGLTAPAGGFYSRGGFCVSQAQPGVLFASDGNGIYRSTDGGATWTEVYVGPANDIRETGGAVWAVHAVVGGGPLCSLDGGTTWNEIGQNWDSAHGWFSPIYGDSQHAYGDMGDSGIWLFTAPNSDLKISNPPGMPWYQWMEINGATGTGLLLRSDSTVYRFTNEGSGGGNAVLTDSSLVAASGIKCIAFDPNTSGSTTRWYVVGQVANGVTVSVSEDDGQTWMSETHIWDNGGGTPAVQYVWLVA